MKRYDATGQGFEGSQMLEGTKATDDIASVMDYHGSQNSPFRSFRHDSCTIPSTSGCTDRALKGMGIGRKFEGALGFVSGGK
jgi:hypothetical protein